MVVAVVVTMTVVLVHPMLVLPVLMLVVLVLPVLVTMVVAMIMTIVTLPKSRAAAIFIIAIIIIVVVIIIITIRSTVGDEPVKENYLLLTTDLFPPSHQIAAKGTLNCPREPPRSMALLRVFVQIYTSKSAWNNSV